MSRRLILLVAMFVLMAVTPAQQAAREAGDAGRGATTQPAPGASTQPATQLQDNEARKREEQLLAVLKERDQASYEAALQLKEADPAEYRRYVHRASAWLDRIKDLPPHVAEAQMALQEAKVKLWRLAELARKAHSEKTKARLARQIRQMVEAQFDAETVTIQYRLEKLRQDMERVEKKLKDRSQQRQQLIQEGVEQVLHPSSQPATQPATQPAAHEKPDKGARQP